MSMNPIQIISASAGSGKTFRLATELSESVKSGEVRPEAVVATTFTVKAASELRQRVRSRLLADGHAEAARHLAAARFGTVHAVCDRLIKDYTFELGLSPDLGVLDQDGAAAALKVALSHAMDSDDERTAKRLAAVFGGEWDWQKDVQAIVENARSNGLGPEVLGKSCEQSIESWKGLLGIIEQDGDAIDKSLKDAFDGFLDFYKTDADTTAKTKTVVEAVGLMKRQLSNGWSVPWASWIKLANGDVAKKSLDAYASVAAAASRHDRHPRLLSDVSDAIELVFKLAAKTLERYAAHKRSLGLLDFADQESLALKLLEREDVRERLADEIDLVMVDEFQDTSPIQLAIFLRLASVARRSVWVGDQKQAIYGFRGTDPALMDAAIDQILKKGKPETLEKSWRSRPELVHLTSDLFAPAFTETGLPEDRVRLEPAHAQEPKGLGAIVECWALDSRNKTDDVLALADCIAQLLKDDVQVRDTVSQKARPVSAADIAVLCRVNDTCRDLANALEARDIRVVLPRAGLMTTPEGKLILSAMRLWADPQDGLAAAEVAYLVDHTDTPNEWLGKAVANPGREAFKDEPVVKRVVEAAAVSAHASPIEALDMVIRDIGAREICHRWGQTEQRLANLEALRAHVTSYVDRQIQQGAAATVLGTVQHLVSLEESDTDKQGVPVGEDAVTVSTWHGAKGLEWPITVLFEMTDKTSTRHALGVHVVSDHKVVDLDDPLAERWIRYWPYPYGKTSKDVPLLERLEEHDDGQEALERGTRESLRLLYVGWTRARDRVVLATRPGKLDDGLLSLLNTNGSEGLAEPEANKNEVTWAERDVTLVRRTGVPAPGVPAIHTPQPMLPEHALQVHPPAVLLPSGVDQKGPVGAIERLGDPLTIRSSKTQWDALGNAVHGFIAADRPDAASEERLAMAQRLLDAWAVAGALNAEDLVSAANRLWQWIGTKWPDATLHREWPLAMREDNGSCWTGTADLVVEHADGFVIIDHKTFPGSPDQAGDVATGYAGQVNAYRRMVAAATDRDVTGLWVHFPVLGAAVEIEELELTLSLTESPAESA